MPDTYDHPPCCSGCDGNGGDAYGPCWDCRSTGHPHPSLEDEAANNPHRITDEEWRSFQNIPEQGYSHRGWVDARITERLNAERKRLASEVEETELISASRRGVTTCICGADIINAVGCICHAPEREAMLRHYDPWSRTIS